MNEDQLAALLRRAAGPAQTRKDQEDKLLDFLVWSLEAGPRPNRDSVAKERAKALAKAPEWWVHHIVLSEESWLAWKTLQALVWDLWHRDPPSVHLFVAPETPTFSPLWYWVIEVAAGKRTEPKKTGPDPTKLYYRNVVIAVTVDEIVGVGRVKAPKACDLVVERLKKEGYELSCKHVYDNIWRPHNKRRSYEDSPSDEG